MHTDTASRVRQRAGQTCTSGIRCDRHSSCVTFFQDDAGILCRPGVEHGLAYLLGRRVGVTR